MPSTSVSLLIMTFPEIGVSSVATTTSSIATGASLTGVRVILNTPVSDPPLPSLIV